MRVLGGTQARQEKQEKQEKQASKAADAAEAAFSAVEEAAEAAEAAEGEANEGEEEDSSPFSLPGDWKEYPLWALSLPWCAPLLCPPLRRGEKLSECLTPSHPTVGGCVFGTDA